MEKTIRQHFAEFIIKTRYEDLSDDVIYQTKKCILDFLGVTLAGSNMGLAPLIKEVICDIGGDEEATIIGDGRRVPTLHAALINGVSGHTLDYDDSHRQGSVHPGIVSIPGPLALGEKENATGKALVVAVVVGYEIAIRIAKAINPSHFNRGFHTTGTVGPFATAAACAKILGLKKREVENALAIAGLQGSGLMEVTLTGQMMKPLQSGKALEAGVLATLLAEKGAEGPDLIFEGENGFFSAFSDSDDFKNVLNNLGNQYEIMNIAFKLYSACRVMHPSVDAVLEIFKRENLDPKDIKAIQVETFPYAIKLCNRIVHPDTILAARFSFPFSLAMAITLGNLSADKFTEKNINDEGIKNLARKVKVSVSEKWEKSYPRNKGASVTIKTHADRAYFSSVPYPKGEPENPARLDELIEKFQANANFLLAEEQSKKLLEVIMNLENLSVRDLAKLF